MFNYLGVAYHQAPGEAEAECARLQRLGVVDAVWSDDCDSFMFGCEVMIRAHKVQNQRVEDTIRIYRASDFKNRLDFDQDSFLMCAMTAGGDYHEGLHGCGANTAKAVAQMKHGLARRLRFLAQEDVPAWRQDFIDLVHSKGPDGKRKWRNTALEIPHDFPDIKVLDKYRNPAISSDKECRNLRGLRGGWEKEINHVNLRQFLRDYHNMETPQYLAHFGGVFLVRALTRLESPNQRKANSIYNIQLKRTV